ncbi:hypothetical protein QA612_08485 [Evansella sp. AB-P1]|uniref:hypothetical protein n=1 Tax=Evansella sp. AB-P1 TaxID=3037653 RepID=UPI00241C0DAF|nr:hypothetical protein [Evansella sp. AB-P1]MDG5787530.1 hypothetical protein [Evansella sp. AB-P1]
MYQMITSRIKRKALNNCVVAVWPFLVFLFSYWIAFGTIPIYNQAMVSSILLLFVMFYFMIFTVEHLFKQISLAPFWMFISVFFYMFIIIGCLWSTTQFIFISTIEYEKVIFVGLVVSFVSACLIGYQYRKHSRYSPFLQQWLNYFKQRSLVDWGIRTIVSLTLLFASYYLMDKLIFPFLEPLYYQQSSVINQYQYNETYNIFGMLIHSIFFIILTIPVFALWRASKSSLLFWIGFPIFFMVAVMPFFINTDWPLSFRFPIFIEMTAILFLQSIILVQLFYMDVHIHKREIN